jgi:NAD(P)-dependent dehydrogenase (short-subunit alcohol dehydrogenase family)
MDLGLQGKVAMVAGASRGLGFAVAEALAREGANVSISSSNRSAIDTASGRLANLGGDIHAAAVDVRNASQIEAWVKETLDTFGGVDLLFANAGGPPAGSALSFDDAAWQNAIDLLLFSALRMVRGVVPAMKQRGGGSILITTSSSVKEPIPNLALSNVVRGGVSSLAKTLALELAADKIAGTFEVRPERRGDIARAKFYFAIRYELPIGDAEEAVLRTWHADDPPDDEERTRDDAIAEIQHNHNPFVVDADLVDQLDDF